MKVAGSDICSTIGIVCSSDDACFGNLRGMTLFGEGTAVPGVGASPYSYDGSVDLTNSVMNRMLNLLDTLATYDAWWAQFLRDTASPYASEHHAEVMPDWAKVVFAGHSQGGGDAALVGIQVAALHHVIMFSDPDDYYVDDQGSYKSASWITAYESASRLTRFWGMRDTKEKEFGGCTSYGWNNLGKDTQSTDCVYEEETAHDWEDFVGKGATPPTGKQFLVTTDHPNSTGLYAHDSTAADDNSLDGSSLVPFSTDRIVAWDYLFAANATD